MPGSAFVRRLSPIERLHAAVGHSGRTLEVPRVVDMILEGAGGETFHDLGRWKKALAEATRENPGASARLTGSLGFARWRSTDLVPPLRYVTGVSWDGRSSEGSEFISETRLSMTEGPTTELLLVDGERRFVILRFLHAAMDGMGAIHFLRDLFRALRGEPLIGTNSTLTDVDVMKSVRSSLAPNWKNRGWAKATGEPEDVVVAHDACGGQISQSPYDPSVLGAERDVPVDDLGKSHRSPPTHRTCRIDAADRFHVGSLERRAFQPDQAVHLVAVPAGTQRAALRVDHPAIIAHVRRGVRQ